jgi:hypothetical protein
LTCGSTEIHKKEGWTVPGLLNAKIKSHATYRNIPDFTITILKPVDDQATLTNIWCSSRNGGTITLEDAPIRVLKLWSWEYKGRIFAYSVEFGKQAIQHGERIDIGAASGLVFYDKEGSGIFSVRKYAQLPITPDWTPLEKKGGHPSPLPEKQP